MIPAAAPANVGALLKSVAEAIYHDDADPVDGVIGGRACGVDGSFEKLVVSGFLMGGLPGRFSKH